MTKKKCYGCDNFFSTMTFCEKMTFPKNKRHGCKNQKIVKSHLQLYQP